MAVRISIALSTSLAMAACASTQPDPNRAAEPACDQTANCFYERNIRSFQVLDDRTVVVLVGRNQCPFKLELDGFFCDLSLSALLTFDDPDGRICRWDRTLVRGGPFARDDEYCRVSQVTPMTDDELLEAYATNGLTPPLPAKGSGELEVVEEEPQQSEVPPAQSTAAETMPQATTAPSTEGLAAP